MPQAFSPSPFPKIFNLVLKTIFLRTIVEYDFTIAIIGIRMRFAISIHSDAIPIFMQYEIWDAIRDFKF